MILLGVIATTTAAVQIVQGECNTLQDCLVFTERLQQQSPLLQKQGGYSCIRNRCTYTVSTGNLCRKVEDCSAFGFVSDSIQRNLSLNFNPTEFLKDLCSPQHCTIQSDCLDASFPFLNQNNSQTQGCCKGIPLEGTCSLTGTEMCTDQHHCYPSPVESSSERICTVENKSNTQWIGIVLTLIGAATCNMALNLMKYAHRKRFEKQISKNGFMYGIKEQISNIYRNISGSTLNRDTVVGNVGIQENDSLDIDLQPNIKRVSAQEKPRFQKRLGMRDLFNNPRWLLGMFIFFLGNICNFIAFNFAAQSLLAPLNSISLVVNVFVAPMINGEIWGWNDVVGIVLIISGSTMVVVFAGFPPKDYTACVLVKLFKRTETIIFLCVTVGIVFLLFWYIVIVEKNLDLESEEIVLDKGKPKLHRRILDRWSKVRGFAFLNNIRLPKLKQKIKLESPLVVYGLPLSYASLGGLTGTITVLFAKATVHLLSATFSGNNQFTNFISFFITIITVFTAVSQIYWINMGLARYDALLQIPVFFVVWTLFDVVGGGIYYDEFRGFKTHQFILFCGGITIIFCGVCVLAGRLKQLHDKDKEEEERIERQRLAALDAEAGIDEGANESIIENGVIVAAKEAES